jgi:ribosomal protein S9
MGVIHKIGRRKTAVTCLCFEGTGVITVNKNFPAYFPTATFTVQS